MRAYGLKNPIAIIPNGIDLPSLVESSELRVEGSIFDRFDQGRKVLLHLGRIHPKKGLVNLLRAWKQTLNLQLSTPGFWPLPAGTRAGMRRNASDCAMKWGLRGVMCAQAGLLDNRTTGQRDNGQWSVVSGQSSSWGRSLGKTSQLVIVIAMPSSCRRTVKGYRWWSWRRGLMASRC